MMLLKVFGLFIALSLFVLQQLASLDSSTPWFIALHNSAHLPWFALISWLICLIVQPKKPSDLLRLSVFLVLLGISSEVLQVFNKRDFSMLDILANLCGAACVLLLYSKFPWRKLLVGVCVLVGLNPLLMVSAAYIERSHYRPEMLPTSAMLINRLTVAKSIFAKITAPESCDHMANKPAYVITFADRPWPNIRLMDVMTDWRAYDHLEVAVCNPALEPLNLWISIHPEDYKNAPITTYREFYLEKGAHRIRIPLTHVLRSDVSRVQDIKLYANKAEQGKSAIVSSITLTRESEKSKP